MGNERDLLCGFIGALSEASCQIASGVTVKVRTDTQADRLASAVIQDVCIRHGLKFIAKQNDVNHGKSASAVGFMVPGYVCCLSGG